MEEHTEGTAWSGECGAGRCRHSFPERVSSPSTPLPRTRLALAEGLLGGGEEGSQLSWKTGQECVAPGFPPWTDPQTYIV